MKTIALLASVLSLGCGKITYEKGDTKVTWENEKDKEQTEEEKLEEEQKKLSLSRPNCETLESQTVYQDEQLFHFVHVKCGQENNLFRIVTDLDLNVISEERADDCLSTQSFTVRKDFNEVSIKCSSRAETIIALNEGTARMQDSSFDDHVASIPEHLQNVSQVFVDGLDIYTISTSDLYPFVCARTSEGFIAVDEPVKFENGFNGHDKLLAYRNSQSTYYVRWDTYTSSLEFGFFEDCSPIKQENFIDILPTNMELKEVVVLTNGKKAILTVQPNAQVLYIVESERVIEKQYPLNSPIHIETNNEKIFINNKDKLQIIQ